LALLIIAKRGSRPLLNYASQSTGVLYYASCRLRFYSLSHITSLSSSHILVNMVHKLAVTYANDFCFIYGPNCPSTVHKLHIYCPTRRPAVQHTHQCPKTAKGATAYDWIVSFKAVTSKLLGRGFSRPFWPFPSSISFLFPLFFSSRNGPSNPTKRFVECY